MAKRDNHYEAAFEAYLRDRRLPYVAVDEGRRALAADGSLKSLDFIVSPPGARSWLVDVKGRRFPSGDEEDLLGAGDQTLVHLWLLPRNAPGSSSRLSG